MSNACVYPSLVPRSGITKPHVTPARASSVFLCERKRCRASPKGRVQDQANILP